MGNSSIKFLSNSFMNVGIECLIHCLAASVLAMSGGFRKKAVWTALSVLVWAVNMLIMGLGRVLSWGKLWSCSLLSYL